MMCPTGGGGPQASRVVPSPTTAVGVNIPTLRSGLTTAASSSSSPMVLLSPTPSLAMKPGPSRPRLIRPTTTKAGFPPTHALYRHGPSPYMMTTAATIDGATQFPSSPTSPRDEWLFPSASHPSSLVSVHHAFATPSPAPAPPRRNRVPSPSTMTPQARHNMLMQHALSTSSAPPSSSSMYTAGSLGSSMPLYPNTTTTSPFGLSVPNNTMRFINDRDEESESLWNLTLSPVCSPLTVDGIESTSAGHASRGPNASPFGFVPIETDATRPSSTTPSPATGYPSPWVTTTIDARSLVSPLDQHDDFEEYKHEEELMLMMQDDTEDALPVKAPTTSSPPGLHPSFKATSDKNHHGKQQKQQAPSPAHTAETSSVMTMDQSSIFSTNTSTTTRGGHSTPSGQTNYLDYISTPPVYPKPVVKATPPPMSSLAAAAAAGRASSVVTVPAVKKPSSLATALAAGRSGNHNVKQTYASVGAAKAASRPQSAPTLGRTTVSSHSSAVVSAKAASNQAKEEDLQQRKSRLKTELCLHYVEGRPCPFGQNCTYAHGEEELQMTKLVDLHEAGLVDMETYRTKPCLTWICTGSCPFGKRCTGIHDHRVVTTTVSHSWLPHTETQGNTIATDINVDGLHQKRLHSILYDNPFGDQFNLSPDVKAGCASTYEGLVGLICGDATDSSRRTSNKDGWIAGSATKRGRHVHPIYKLQIALKLRGTDSDWMYKYRPQHIVNDELCMVLQKRAFRVTSNEHSAPLGSKTHTNRCIPSSSATATSSVVEISINDYNSRIPSHIIVHEIAFGPDCDPSAPRGLALWFNVSESEITVCTPQQAKRFRWKKTTVNPQANKKFARGEADNGSPEGADNESVASIKPSVFDSGAIEHFPMIRPHDEAAFRLVTEIMKHSLALLKRDRMSAMKDRYDALQKLQRQEVWLKERFENQRRTWVQWSWPVNIGRSNVDDNTPVPSVEGPYLLKPFRDARPPGFDNQSELNAGRNVHRIWNAFVGTFVNDPKDKDSSSIGATTYKRLSVFEHLAQGKPIDECRVLPHIVKHCSTKVKRLHGGQPDRCWKALLLPSASPHDKSEWDIVRDHFENSRSKKVLTILQQ